MSRPARQRRGARIPRWAPQRVKCRAVMDGSPLTFRSEPCEAVDPLQVFAAAGAAPRFYWEQPAAGRFRVGVGCAARLTVRGHERFRAADELAGKTFGRITLGRPGTADFAPARAALPSRRQQSANGLWQGFPDGELRLPELIYWREQDRYVRDALVGSHWADLRPRPLAARPAGAWRGRDRQRRAGAVRRARRADPRWHPRRRPAEGRAHPRGTHHRRCADRRGRLARRAA